MLIYSKNLYKTLILLVICVVMVSSAALSDVVETAKNPLRWTIHTESSTYQIAVASDGAVIPVYYGPKGDFQSLHGARIQVNKMTGSAYREVPYRGGFVYQTPQLEVLYADGTRDAELVYVSHKINETDGYASLRIDLMDKAYGLSVSQWYRVIPELDLIQKWMDIKNLSKQTVVIENAQSGSIELEADEYDFYHLSGQWGMECMPQKTRLTTGTKTLQVRNFRCFTNPPWFAVGRTDAVSGTDGDLWFGGIEWSGNWRLDAEKRHSGEVQIVGGINFWDTHWTLNAGENFETPRIVFGFTGGGLGGASHRMHEYALNHLLRPTLRHKFLPVLYNSWYATTFNITESQQLALAKKAKRLGVELFCIDDGWFKGRQNDHAGLGDWVVDRDKFPNDLHPMIKQINDMGLDFGIWVEPEMVNPDSDLYREHPDWCFNYPKRTRHEGRNQLMLNLAREDVFKYLLDSMNHLLTEYNIAFIKWDYNRDLSEPGWPDADPAMQREVRIRYFYNFHRLLNTLRRRFPKVIFECCSGGGGRINYHNLSIMDQFWASDNTDPADRVMIQYGFLQAFPAKTMVSWITHEDWHKTKPSMKFRFHAGMCGILGVGDDITKWSDEQIKEAAEYIHQYKQIRLLVQHGIVHRLISPFKNQRSALQYVSKDGADAAVFQFNLWETLPGSTESRRKYRPVRLRGLDPEALYVLSGDIKKTTASGETLMNTGLPWAPKGNIQSALIQIRKK